MQNKKKRTETFDYYSELMSRPFYAFGNGKSQEAMYYAEVLSLDVPDAAGTIDVEIQLLPRGVKPAALKPLGARKDSSNVPGGNSSHNSSEIQDNEVWGFGTESARYGDGTSTRRLVNYDISGLDWNPPRNYASVKFTMILTCDDSATMLKDSPSVTGNWRLKQQGWLRLFGFGEGARSGCPMPKMENFK